MTVRRTFYSVAVSEGIKTGRWAGSAVVLLIALVAGYYWWTKDERAIRSQLQSIADALTVSPDEGDLGRITRVAMLGKVLAPEIRVSVVPPQDAAPGLAQPTGPEIVGRDSVLAMVSRWNPPPGGVEVEFEEVAIAIDRSAARVDGVARVASRANASGEPVVESLDLLVEFEKIDGVWLVTSASTEG
jgi:hypothetical protein